MLFSLILPLTANCWLGFENGVRDEDANSSGVKTVPKIRTPQEVRGFSMWIYCRFEHYDKRENVSENKCDLTAEKQGLNKR